MDKIAKANHFRIEVDMTNCLRGRSSALEELWESPYVVVLVGSAASLSWL